MKRKIALAMVLAMTATMAQPVLAADDKTTLDHQPVWYPDPGVVVPVRKGFRS